MIDIPMSLIEAPRKDFRDAIFSEIADYIRDNENAILLTYDMGAQGIDKIKAFFPKQVLNVGITEQNMMSVAAGLALSGHFVFVYGIAEHLILRALEQIKLDICVQNLPVCIVGVGAGLAYGQDGPTHHGTEDIAVMRAIPNISIYNPSDCFSAKKSVSCAVRQKTPSYIRMDKEQLPEMYTSGRELEHGYGVHGTVSGGAFISTGVIGWPAFAAMEKLKTHGVECFCVDIWRLKPVNWDKLISTISGADWFVFLDESVKTGGLAETVLGNCQNMKPKFVISLDLGNSFLLGSANREWVWKNIGAKAQNLVSNVLENLENLVTDK